MSSTDVGSKRKAAESASSCSGEREQKKAKIKINEPVLLVVVGGGYIGVQYKIYKQSTFPFTDDDIKAALQEEIDHDKARSCNGVRASVNKLSEAVEKWFYDKRGYEREPPGFIPVYHLHELPPFKGRVLFVEL